MNEHRLKRFEGSFYICGFMGAGKSSVGRLLAKELGLPFHDLDKYLEKKEGRKIADIFGEEGEDYFRKKEWEYLLDLTRSFKGVVALGGGALQNQQIVDHLKLHGLLILIDVPMDVILDRVMRNKKRPIVVDEEGKIKSRETLLKELNVLYSKRFKYYKQAQITITTDGKRNKKDLIPILTDKIKQHV